MNASIKKPYVGPRTFQENERDRFFGRDREARDLLALAVSEQLVLFYAQSGAGKSSLVNTCLIPDLKNKGFKVFSGRVIGDAPTGFDVDNIYVFNLIRSLIPNEVNLASLVKETISEFFLTVADNAPGTNIDDEVKPHVLIIDQFEELFNTHHEAWEKREDFFQQLAKAMEADPYLWVIFVMREDFIAALDPYAYMLPSRLRMRYYMQRLEHDAALEAIKKPVKDLRPFASGVAETLVDNLARINIKLPDGNLDSQPGQYIEPVQLQVVCYSLWENLKSTRPYITEEDLKEVGDVNQSLENFYNERVGSVALKMKVDERLIREWFDHELITIDGTRNMVLRNLKNDGELDDHVIQALQGDLVRAEMRGGQTWYELSHDRLIEPVHVSNTKWFTANLSFFQQQAARWVAQDRSEGMLLRGRELELAEQEMERRQVESKSIPKDELDFFAACVKAREREKREKRGNWLLRILAVGASVLFFISILFAFRASAEADRAEGEKIKAQDAVVTATYALGEKADANNKLAGALGLLEAEALAGQAQIALKQSDTVQLGRLLSIEAFETSKASGKILPSVFQALVTSIAEEKDLDLSDLSFSSASFSFNPTRKRLVVDNYLWNLEDNQWQKLDSDSSEIVHSSFLSDEKVAVIASNNDYFSVDRNPFNINIINFVDQERSQIPLIIPEDAYFPIVRMSENNQWVALAFSSFSPSRGGVSLWSTEDANQVSKVFSVQYPAVQDVAISHDGTSMTVVDEKYLYFWRGEKNDFAASTDVLIADIALDDKGFSVGAFSGKSGRGLQYSPDGQLLAMQTEKNIYLFNPDTQKLVGGTPPLIDEEVVGYLFSPDNKYLVYVTRNDKSSSVVRWPLQDPASKTYEIYKSTSADITAMDISANGRLVVGDEAGYVRAWDIGQDSKTPVQTTSVHSGKVTNILIGPDDQAVISASVVDGTRLWYMTASEDSDTRAVIDYRIPNAVSSVVRSDNGDFLAIGGINSETEMGSVRLYSNLQTPEVLDDLSFGSYYGSSLQALAVSSDWVAAGRTDFNTDSYYLDFWARSPTDVNKSFVSFALSSEITSMAFYPDGRYLVIATESGEMWIDDTEELSGLMSLAPTPESEPPSNDLRMPYYIQLSTNLTDIQSLLFTQGGRYLIGSSQAGVRIWETAKFAEGLYYQPPNAIYPAAISPDQKWLVTSGSDKTVQIYDIENILSSPAVIPVEKNIVTHFAFDQINDWLAVANKTGDILIYQLPIAGYPVVPVYSLQGPNDEITWLEFSPLGSKGNWLVASSGEEVYLWNMISPNDKSITLQSKSNTTFVYSSFTNDGEWIITSSVDQTLQFWSMDLERMKRAACKFAERNFTRREWIRYFPGRGDLEETCQGFDYGLEQIINIAEGGPVPTPYPTLSVVQPDPTSETSLTPSATTFATSGNFIEYTIQEGDLLALIAGRFNVDLNTLIADNNISNPNLIVPGQILKIRAPSTSSTP